MKQYRGPDGRPRVWFAIAEIEHMMEDELEKAGLYPSPNQPIVDVEKLLEGRLGAKLDQYADLEHAVLGLTTFTRGQKPKVEINKDLTGAVYEQEEAAPGLLGRWRATLAHEAAHVIMHRLLYEVPLAQGNLFEERVSDMQAEPVSMQCLKRDVSFATGQSDWREVQANKGMAALLMPRKLMGQMVGQAVPVELGGLPERGSREAQLLSTRVSELFQVSRQAAMIRIEDLGLVILKGQRQLGGS